MQPLGGKVATLSLPWVCKTLFPFPSANIFLTSADGWNLERMFRQIRLLLLRHVKQMEKVSNEPKEWRFRHLGCRDSQSLPTVNWCVHCHSKHRFSRMLIAVRGLINAYLYMAKYLLEAQWLALRTETTCSQSGREACTAVCDVDQGGFDSWICHYSSIVNPNVLIVFIHDIYILSILYGSRFSVPSSSVFLTEIRSSLKSVKSLLID